MRANSRREARTARLRELVSAEGTIAAVARKAQVSEKYLSQVLSGVTQQRGKSPRGIGDEVAEKLETAFGKAPGWMDSGPETTQSTDATAHPLRMSEALSSIRNLASPRSQMTLDRLADAARAGELSDDDWALIDAIVARIRKR